MSSSTKTRKSKKVDQTQTNRTDAKTGPTGSTTEDGKGEAQAKTDSPESTSPQDPRLAQLSPQMRQAIQSRVLAGNFGNIVTILMQSPAHQNVTLNELQSLIVPPIINKQFTIAEAYKKNTGFTIPVAMALWARVSDEVDQKLSTNLESPVKLSAEEWTSGDHIWLIEVVGEKRFVKPMLTKLFNEAFKGKPVKARTIDKDGERTVSVWNDGKVQENTES